ncbi:unnamed protein product [Mytilus coruscus]|uniref:BEN domain-containing protein n=1 Tax=Mytilus coruscus TaxID=42192 RepID=A0A6J8B3Y7_MYTCO|nr:unnamed protein product [Mytilus coruscus]
MEAVEQKTTWQGAVDTLLNKLLSEEELRNKSISGKKTVKCGTDGPRPPMDQDKLCKLIDTVINRFPDAKKKGIVEKIQNVQKPPKDSADACTTMTTEDDECTTKTTEDDVCTTMTTGDDECTTETTEDDVCTTMTTEDDECTTMTTEDDEYTTMLTDGQEKSEL